jgi:hypothetical protein
MVSYKILHHVAGRIRIAVPLLKDLPLFALAKLASIPVADGILAVEPNFFSRNIVIRYDPTKIDILDYLRTMASHPEIEKTIKDESSEPSSAPILP